MPLGVENAIAAAFGIAIKMIPKPLMPLGVEHTPGFTVPNSRLEYS